MSSEPASGDTSATWIAEREPRLNLAFLWAWTLVNYVYGDILHLFTIFTRPDVQRQLERGSLGGIPFNDTSTLVMAAVMELAIAMIFLSWKLARRLNRILNIAIGILFTIVMVAILFGSGRLPPLSGYTLYGLIEIATTMSIVAVAWRWRGTPAAV